MARPAPRFDRLALIGEGGMGRVELVDDHDIGRQVAVKHLKESQDPSHVLRFAREVRCLGQLQHPGVVPLYDVGRGEDGSYYLIMKHLEGETLQSLIRRLRGGDPDAHQEYPLPERVRICQAVLHIMEYAHERGILHRDLKPSNVMIGTHGEVTILDWGLARRVGDPVAADDDPFEELPDLEPGSEGARPGAGGTLGTEVDAVLGTPLYMAPEQAAGDHRAVGPASDVYSMAVMFYELLTLQHYLADLRELSAVLDGVRQREPRLAYWIRNPHQERVPIELAYWLQRAMQKDPGDRFGSAEEMRRALQDVVDGDFAVVCPTTFSRRMFRCGMNTANRRPLLMLLSISMVAAFFTYGLFRAISDWL